MKLPKHAELWLPDYLRERRERRRDGVKPKRLWVALTDHYEPLGGGVSLERAKARIAAWQERWPEIAAAAPRDAAGHPPRFTFF